MAAEPQTHDVVLPKPEAFPTWVRRGARHDSWRRVRLGTVVCAVAASLLGCGVWPSSAWPNKPRAQKPVPASISDPAPPELGFIDSELVDDAIVRLTTSHVACTGTLIAPKLVLTAHHCVAERDEFGEFLSRDVDPSEIHVELGGDFLPWAEVGVEYIVAPPCGYAAGVGDIAVLVLNQELEGVALKEVRLDEPPQVGDTIAPSGFGQCADSEQGVRRHSREGGNVENVYASRMRAQAAVCPGDSGGPGVDSKNRVVGVVSASAMDRHEKTRNVTEFTRVDHFREVFANGLRLAEGENAAELPPLSCPEE